MAFHDSLAIDGVARVATRQLGPPTDPGRSPERRGLEILERPWTQIG